MKRHTCLPTALHSWGTKERRIRGSELHYPTYIFEIQALYQYIEYITYYTMTQYLTIPALQQFIPIPPFHPARTHKMPPISVSSPVCWHQKQLLAKCAPCQDRSCANVHQLFYTDINHFKKLRLDAHIGLQKGCTHWNPHNSIYFKSRYPIPNLIGIHYFH